MLFTSIRVMQCFAFMLTVAVLVDTFVVRAIVVPALFAVLGPLVWSVAPSRLLGTLVAATACVLISCAPHHRCRWPRCGIPPATKDVSVVLPDDCDEGDPSSHLNKQPHGDAGNSKMGYEVVATAAPDSVV